MIQTSLFCVGFITIQQIQQNIELLFEQIGFCILRLPYFFLILTALYVVNLLETNIVSVNLTK